MTAGPYSIGSDIWPGLAKAMEECGELVQAAGKIIAAQTGTEADEYSDGTDLRIRLEDEISDVRAALAFLVEMNTLDDSRMLDRLFAKLALFRQWHAEHSDGSNG